MARKKKDQDVEENTQDDTGEETTERRTRTRSEYRIERTNADGTISTDLVLHNVDDAKAVVAYLNNLDDAVVSSGVSYGIVKIMRLA